MPNLRFLGLCILLFLWWPSFGRSQEASPILPALSDMSIDMQWFLSYLSGTDKKKNFSQFGLKRGYVNIKKPINKNFSGRITTDITTDKEGDGEGDVEMRLKYLYLKYSLPSAGFLYKPYFEFGLVHRPWIDFEQEINAYRVQGTMFLERTDVVNSADNGIIFFSLLGGEMDANYQETVNNSFPGKYGSVALGIFNGGGYHALEKNRGKTLEGRLTLRPLPTVIPGLQFTYHGAHGKGNTTAAPEWKYSSFYLSWEHQKMILTAEYYLGTGNFEGNAIKDTISHKAIPQNGLSVFAEWKVLNEKFSLFGRYDYFEQEYSSLNLASRRSILGLAYHFVHGSKIIIDYDKLLYSIASKHGSRIFEIAIELKY